MTQYPAAPHWNLATNEHFHKYFQIKSITVLHDLLKRFVITECRWKNYLHLSSALLHPQKNHLCTSYWFIERQQIGTSESQKARPHAPNTAVHHWTPSKQLNTFLRVAKKGRTWNLNLSPPSIWPLCAAIMALMYNKLCHVNGCWRIKLTLGFI